LGAAGLDHFVFGEADGMEEELADVSEEASVAMGDAILSDGSIELAEDGIEVRGGEVMAGGSSGEEMADVFGFEELALVARVMEAEGMVILGARHTATAAIGVSKFTT